ncbi:MAG: hypothetical protein QOD74_2738 [Variibacter sp.]|jgi:hypothetical protein|nr:hypothetical protein [Variibacter sp.]
MMSNTGPNGREVPEARTEDEKAQEMLGGERGIPGMEPAPMTPQRAKKTDFRPRER